MLGKFFVDEYHTTELHEVAYLSARGMHFTTREDEKGLYTFIFQANNDNVKFIIERSLNVFWRGEDVNISPKRLLDEYRNAKKIVVIKRFSKNHYDSDREQRSKDN